MGQGAEAVPLPIGSWTETFVTVDGVVVNRGQGALSSQALTTFDAPHEKAFASAEDLGRLSGVINFDTFVPGDRSTTYRPVDVSSTATTSTTYLNDTSSRNLQHQGRGRRISRRPGWTPRGSSSEDNACSGYEGQSIYIYTNTYTPRHPHIRKLYYSSSDDLRYDSHSVGRGQRFSCKIPGP